MDTIRDVFIQQTATDLRSLTEKQMRDHDTLQEMKADIKLVQKDVGIISDTIKTSHLEMKGEMKALTESVTMLASSIQQTWDQACAARAIAETHIQEAKNAEAEASAKKIRYEGYLVYGGIATASAGLLFLGKEAWPFLKTAFSMLFGVLL
jgi:hypothetical protein